MDYDEVCVEWLLLLLCVEWQVKTGKNRTTRTDREEPNPVVEEPATFSPAEEKNYSEGDEYPAHTNGPEDEIDNTDEFLAFSAVAVDSLGGKRLCFPGSYTRL